MALSTPILLITFNRPAHSRKVLSEIIKSDPQDVFVFQDGPREGNDSDIEKCDEVRRAIDELTEHTEITVHKYYSTNNLGCGPGPTKAITWFFENVEQGIIIEDDCVLSPLAFIFYAELLNRYKDDERIFSITATNLHLKWRSNKQHYLFSTVGSGTLGCWATWRRAWKYFDYNISKWNTLEGRIAIKENLGNNIYFRYYAKIFDICSKPQTHMWDYQWFFAKTINNKLSIVASLNQVSNIGFDEMGTHTQSESRLANFPTYSISFPLKASQVKRSWLFDWVVFQRYYYPKRKSIAKRVLLKSIDLLFRH